MEKVLTQADIYLILKLYLCSLLDHKYFSGLVFESHYQPRFLLSDVVNLALFELKVDKLVDGLLGNIVQESTLFQSEDHFQELLVTELAYFFQTENILLPDLFLLFLILS